MNAQYIPLIQTGLTVAGSLFLGIGSWCIAEKANKKKEQEAYTNQLNTIKSNTDSKIDALKDELTITLDQHRNEYLTGITDVKDTLTALQGVYQRTTDIVQLKIDNLEKKQDKHNSIIERTFLCEKELEVLKNRESVSEHRLDDLERHEENHNG